MAYGLVQLRSPAALGNTQELSYLAMGLLNSGLEVGLPPSAKSKVKREKGIQGS